MVITTPELLTKQRVNNCWNNYLKQTIIGNRQWSWWWNALRATLAWMPHVSTVYVAGQKQHLDIYEYKVANDKRPACWNGYRSQMNSFIFVLMVLF